MSKLPTNRDAGVKMNADKIKIALAKVHLYERQVRRPNGMSRVDAYKVAITGSGLTQDELQILRNALHITDAEVSK